jgi:predicted enzyme related to lactoylglutathione lyase
MTTKNAINWFEILTSDLERAAKFYETTLGVSLKRETFQGTPHAIFGGDGVRGALIFDAKRKPIAGGAMVYLDAPDLDAALARVPKAGGKVLLGKTEIGDPGAIAIVLDTEGNHVGLHAPRR